MKKWIAVLMALVLMLGMTSALAEDGLGVQLIGGPEAESEPVSLDDVKIDANVDIPGFGTIKPRYFTFKTEFHTDRHNSWGDTDGHDSGKEAQFAMFYMDILNTNTKSQNYLDKCEIQVIFDDVYIYGGWARQIDYDRLKNGEKDCDNQVLEIPDHYFAIDPMYKGHYVFGCTLPNAVVESKAPLRMTINLAGNEITYNIRK